MPDLIRPPFPAVVDATILAAFRACAQKAFRTYFQHWKPKAESVHLIAGAAFAKGLEVSRRCFYEQGMDQETAIGYGLQALIQAYGQFECPADSPKSLERMAGALEYYFDQYPMATDAAQPWEIGNGKRAIEFAFAEPLDVLHPTTGDPIIYSGRSDMMCTYASALYIEDDKTTSSLGAQWVRAWDLRSQFSGYAWASRRAGNPVAGILVRGISILKTKYDKAQALTYRADWELDRWYEQTLRDIRRMIKCWEEGYWDYALDDACTQYGGCPLNSICKSQEPEVWLPMYFEPRVWNPLTREETYPDGTLVRPKVLVTGYNSPLAITKDTEFVFPE